MQMRSSTSPARLVLALAAITLACTTSAHTAPISIAVTLPDVGLIVSAVAGDLARVACITPGGADPHSFTLSAQQVTELRSADLVVFAGTSLLEFEADLLAGLRAGAPPRPAILDWPDYERRGARLRDVPGVPRNPHGPWMAPENAVAMAGAVADRLALLGAPQDILKANLAQFSRELAAGQAAARALARREGAPPPLVAVVPGVADVILASGHPVALVLLPTEGASFASASDVTAAVSRLRSGEWGGLVCPEIARDSKPGEIARQVAADSGARVYYVRFLSAAGDEWSYVSQMAYNAAVLSGAGTPAAIAPPSSAAPPSWWLWGGLLVAAVAAVAVLAAALARARCEARHAVRGAGIFDAPSDDPGGRG